VGYHLRVFCKSEDLPPLGRVLDWAAAQGVWLELEDEPDRGDLDSARWRGAEIRYKHGKRPFVVDVSRAAQNRLRLSEEIQEFIEFLNDVNESAEKAKVLAQLRETRAVVSAQLLSDIDDDGYHAVGIFLSFFVAHCDGMIQADGEGFYEGDRTIVELA
jgi:hypothetical protein